MDEADNALVPAFTNGAESGRPSVSRDGATLAFLSRTNEIDGTSGFVNYDVFLRENGVNRRLTRMETFLSDMALSPDGAAIVFIDDKGRDRHERLWLMAVDGSAFREIRIPGWSRP